MLAKNIFRTINVQNKNILIGPSRLGGTRLLNVHEYVSMDIMRSFNIPVPRGGMATSVEEANQVYKTIIGEGKDCVIKAMVLIMDLKVVYIYVVNQVMLQNLQKICLVQI